MGQSRLGNGDLCSWGWGFFVENVVFRVEGFPHPTGSWGSVGVGIEVVEREYESGGLRLAWKRHRVTVYHS